MHIDKRWVFEPVFYIQNEESLFYLVDSYFNSVYKKNYELNNTNDVTSSFYTSTKNHFEINCCLFITLSCLIFKNGCKINKNELSGLLMLDLIAYYLILNKLYLYNGNVYKKVGGFEISYELVGSIKNLLFDEFEKNVFGYFFLNYPCHMEGLDLWCIIKTYKNDFEPKILKIGLLSQNILNPDFTVMEFNDGIYDIKNNKFYHDKNKFNNKRVTLKYYNKSYSRTRQDQPET